MKFRIPHLIMMLSGALLTVIGSIIWVFAPMNAPRMDTIEITESADVPTPEYVAIGKLIRPAVEGSTERTDAGETGESGVAQEAAKININAATAEELMALPRVGEKTAQAILEYRASKGAFKTLDDLGAIKGLGKKTIDRFRDLAYCGPVAEVPIVTPAGSAGETRSSAETRSPEHAKPGSVDTSGSNPSCDGSRININTATEEELQTLPRIGPAMAAKIVQYREENGRFASIEALKKVKGIGAKTFERLERMICAE